MLATTPLFYAYNWPRSALSSITCTRTNSCTPQSDSLAAADADDNNADNISEDAVETSDDEPSRNTPEVNTSSKVCTAAKNW